VWRRRAEVRGVRIAAAPDVLRHFGARFARIHEVRSRPLATSPRNAT